MEDYGLLGKPMTLAKAIVMNPGDFSKQENIFMVPADHLFIIESVGVGASLQEDQTLSSSIMPVLDGGLTVYPLAILGESASHNPQMPLRRFGSQYILLYANNRIDIGAFRSNDAGSAQIEFNVSGRLLVPASDIQQPTNLRTA